MEALLAMLGQGQLLAVCTAQALQSLQSQASTVLHVSPTRNPYARKGVASRSVGAECVVSGVVFAAEQSL